ncbi:hypothetical protein [Aminipila terrae]|nr:hypothetical protein [Aminipila terrae]
MEVTILGRKDLEKTIEMPKVIEKVMEAYKSKSNGKTTVWPLYLMIL